MVDFSRARKIIFTVRIVEFLTQYIVWLYETLSLYLIHSSTKKKTFLPNKRCLRFLLPSTFQKYFNSHYTPVSFFLKKKKNFSSKNLLYLIEQFDLNGKDKLRFL